MGSGIILQIQSIMDKPDDGWGKVLDVNLYNAEDLPAMPFRTDVE